MSIDFDYIAPSSLDECIRTLADNPQAVPLAGGTDLVPMLHKGLVNAPLVVSLKSVADLRGISQDDNVLRVGAMTALRELAEDDAIRSSFLVLAEAAQSVGSPQIRNAGTVGGNLCQQPRCWYFRRTTFECLKKGGKECLAVKGANKYHAIVAGGPCFAVHPSDLAPVLLVLDAAVIAIGPQGERRIGLENFLDVQREDITRQHTLERGEILTAIEIPLAQASRPGVFLKFTERQGIDFALVSLAMSLRVDRQERIADARIALGGVAPAPWRWSEAESTFVEQRIHDVVDALSGFSLDGVFKPFRDNAFKVRIAHALLERALRRVTTERIKTK